MRFKCSCCDRENEERHFLGCSICHKKYQLTCIDVTKAEACRIRVDSGLTWSCVACRAFAGGINELKQVIMNLQTEIQGLKGTAHQGIGCSLPPTDFEKVVQEVMERERRKTNIIIYKLAEDGGASRGAQAELDAVTVGRILTDLGVADGGAPLQIQRLGKFDPTKHDLRRPLRVQLHNESVVMSIIRNSAKLRDQGSWKHISLSRDRTPKQVELYRMVRAELDGRVAAGETDLKIKYVAGIPTIVSLN